MILNNYFKRKQGLKSIKTKSTIKDIFWAKKGAKKISFLTFLTNKQQKYLTTSSDNKEESSGGLFFDFIESETAEQARRFETINKELEAFLAKENNDKDATDGILGFLAAISDSVQGEFDKLVSGDSDKSERCEKYSRYYSTQKLTLPKKSNLSLKSPQKRHLKYSKNQGNSKKITCQDEPLTCVAGQERMQ